MKRNTFFLKGFIQFTCTNLDGSQKEGGNFLNLLQKEVDTQKGGVPSEKGGSNHGGNYGNTTNISRSTRRCFFRYYFKKIKRIFVLINFVKHL